MPSLHEQLLPQTAVQRVHWALANASHPVLSTSFGAQSAVLLHVVTTIRPDIPVVFVDTGYLFPHTYRYADVLQSMLNLNLHVQRPRLSVAWMEARHGKLWEQGVKGLDAYNRLRKIEPMEQALQTLSADVWLSGVRAEQSAHRAQLPIAEHKNGRLKVHPLWDWSSENIAAYHTRHNLPVHPLVEEGYVSIGDIHSTVPLSAGMSEEQTRFGGVKRECGLHV